MYGNQILSIWQKLRFLLPVFGIETNLEDCVKKVGSII
jgi:hypothetical protein